MVYYLWRFSILRLVFASDGVVVGVVIRSIERYDLVEIKSTDSELSRTLISLMTVAYDQVKTVSGSQAEAEENTNHNARFQAFRLVVLLLLFPSQTTKFLLDDNRRPSLVKTNL